MKAFKELLGDPGDWRASPKGLNFSRLNDMEALRLEVPFMEDEVHVALADLNGDKLPGRMVLRLHFDNLVGMLNRILWGCLEIFMIMGAL